MDIAVTRQRPDIVIFSQSLRVVILIELTVPLEDRIAAASTRKTDRYSALLATCENNGWHATHFPVEVGSRGWVAHSLLTCLQKLGFSASWCKKVRQECCRVALRCSYLLYLRRSIHTWNSSMSFHLNQAQVARTMTRRESRLTLVRNPMFSRYTGYQSLIFLVRFIFRSALLLRAREISLDGF